MDANSVSRLPINLTPILAKSQNRHQRDRQLLVGPAEEIRGQGIFRGVPRSDW